MNLIMEVKYYRWVNGVFNINEPSVHTATNNLVRTVGKQNLSEFISLGGIRVGAEDFETAKWEWYALS